MPGKISRACWNRRDGTGGLTPELKKYYSAENTDGMNLECLNAVDFWYMLENI